MDVREKLVGLVHNARMNALWHNAQKPDEYITDMLMEDGVTVQEWISVKDRLPETNGFRVWVVACVDGKKSCVRLFERTTVRGKLVERFKYPWETITYENITHWMPLPQPPKGE